MIIDAGYIIYAILEDGERDIVAISLSNATAHRVGNAIKEDNPYVVDYYLVSVKVV